jgi:hypothetical protein
LIAVAQRALLLKPDHKGGTIMQPTQGRPWQRVVVISVVVLGLIVLVTLSCAQASSNPNPGVFPIDSRPFGHTYGEWSARWWQWALSVPEETNPLLDPTGVHCAEGQAGPVWFLAGTFGGTATRTCTVPAGKALFFPLLNTIFGAGVGDCEPTNPGVPCDVDALREAAAAPLENPQTLEASIDGVPLQDLSAYRVQSPVFSITFPEDAVFGLPSGTFEPNVSDGYWLMLVPLSAGEHTIYFKAVSADGFTSEVTYHLTISRRD